VLHALIRSLTIEEYGGELPWWKLFRTYARLKLRGYCERLFSGLRSPRARLFGFIIEFLEYSTFVFLFEEIFLDGDYYFRAAGPRPLILDCGSHVGLSVLYFKTLYPGCRIIAFEPDESTFRVLKRNMEMNHLQDVEVHQQALSRAEGKVNFYSDPERPGAVRMSTLEVRMPKAVTPVDGVALSSFITDPVDFLKLDVEGAETVVIEDLVQHDKLRMVREMVIEYHHHIDPSEDHLAKLLATLEEHGFGYQVSARVPRPFSKGAFQDIVLYAYRADVGEQALAAASD